MIGDNMAKTKSIIGCKVTKDHSRGGGKVKVTRLGYKNQ